MNLRVAVELFRNFTRYTHAEPQINIQDWKQWMVGLEKDLWWMAEIIKK